ncbi:Lysine-specific demethylase 8, partial [Podochytrium sp. JEL0797]
PMSDTPLSLVALDLVAPKARRLLVGAAQRSQALSLGTLAGTPGQTKTRIARFLAFASAARDECGEHLVNDDRAAVHTAAYAASALFVAEAHLAAARLADTTPRAKKALARKALRAIDLAVLRAGVHDWKALSAPLARDAALLLAEENAHAKPVSRASLAKNKREIPRPQQYLNTPNAKEIPRVDSRSLSVEDFCNQYIAASRPVIITNVVSEWPAFTKWKDPTYLKTLAHGRLVPVETYAKEDASKSYLSDSWSHKVMPLDEYISQYILKEPRSDDSAQDEKEAAYLAQHPLFDQIPELRDDIRTPIYCSARTPQDLATPSDCEFAATPLVSAWFGPGGTVSPIHSDPYHNVLAQIVGSKYLRIYNAQDTDAVYPETTHLGHNSRVDVDAPQQVLEKQFPKFVAAQCWQTILKEGELLYIPRHAWHYVRSLETSFSASMWFGAKTELKKKKGVYTPMYLKKGEKGKTVNLQ